LTFQPVAEPTADGPVVGVDLGLRTGIAVYVEVDGRLVLRRYGSTHVADRAALRRVAASTLAPLPPRPLVVVEGDVALGRIWERPAVRASGRLLQVPTERWREALLLPREQRRGADAKRHARTRARAVVDWSREVAGADGPPAVAGELRHDTAEAILIGLYGALVTGRLEASALPFDVPGVP
jgi:hypothetical protein